MCLFHFVGLSPNLTDISYMPLDNGAYTYYTAQMM